MVKNPGKAINLATNHPFKDAMNRDLKSRDEAIRLVRDQLKIEGELINEYQNSADTIENPVARLLLQMLAMDSRKHAAICDAALKILEGETIYSDEKAEIYEGIQKHIQLEAEAYERATKILNNPHVRSNPGLWSLVERLQNDERTHHRILMEISKRAFVPVNLADLSSIFRGPKWFEEMHRRRMEEED